MFDTVHASRDSDSFTCMDNTHNMSSQSWAELDLSMISKSWTRLRYAWFTLSDTQLHTIPQELWKVKHSSQVIFHAGVEHINAQAPSLLTDLFTRLLNTINCTLYNHTLLGSTGGGLSHCWRGKVRWLEKDRGQLSVWQMRSEKTITANYPGMKSQGLCT